MRVSFQFLKNKKTHADNDQVGKIKKNYVQLILAENFHKLKLKGGHYCKEKHGQNRQQRNDYPQCFCCFVSHILGLKIW